MLKIRISGSKDELQLVSRHMADATIKKYKQPNGKMAYAIDSTISVEDFLAKNIPAEDADSIKAISQELSEILDIID